MKTLKPWAYWLFPPTPPPPTRDEIILAVRNYLWYSADDSRIFNGSHYNGAKKFLNDRGFSRLSDADDATALALYKYIKYTN